jgi:hypothetical protein
MAVTSGPLPKTFWLGLSTDTKPIAGVEFAAQFYEYDSGKTYIFTGQNLTAPAGSPIATQWVEYLPMYPTGLDQFNPFS